MARLASSAPTRTDRVGTAVAEAPSTPLAALAGAPMTRIDPSPLDVVAHLTAVNDARAGAVASFLGTVRDHDPEVRGEVVALEYSAHPDAAAVLARIAADAAALDGVLAVAVSHRIGRLAVGDVAIVAAVSTAHRELAFSVCRTVVERVKAELPMWKREILADGTYVWVGLGAGSNPRQK